MIINTIHFRYSSNTATRQMNDISHSRPRTKFSARTPSHCTPTIWNALTPQMKQMINRNQLKITIIQSMISSYDSNVACDNPRYAECAPPNEIVNFIQHESVMIYAMTIYVCIAFV